MTTINELLVTFEDIKSYIPDIADNYDRSEIEPYIIDVQRFELSQLIGSSLYRECYINKLQVIPVDYTILISGGSFNDCHGNLVDYYGLIPFLAYSVYCRLLISSNIKVTRSGPMQKTNPYSSKVQGGELKTSIDMASQKAAFYKQNILDFLCQESINYPLYSGCNSQSALPRTQAIIINSGYFRYPDQGSSFRYF